MQYIQMPFDRLHKDEFEPLESAAVDLEETREAHVITFEVGAALEDAKSQVPCYCFVQTNATELVPVDVGAITRRGLVDSRNRKVEDMTMSFLYILYIRAGMKMVEAIQTLQDYV
ncbi:hypothetical protein Tco_0259880 [Tanacetum coccineum]